ncbi:MAG: 30S ribosomal protein S6 [bacterium]|nr:30S ribosomal protein S6 [bacterium]
MEMKKKYELMVIISSTIADPEIKERLKGLKEQLGKEIVFEEIWGMRDFAYPIKNQRKGYYAVWNFLVDGEEIKELEENLKLYPNLVRHLIMQVPDDYKPFTLKELETEMDKLRKEKAEKRGGKKRPKKAEEKRVSKATTEKKLEEAIPEKEIRAKKEPEAAAPEKLKPTESPKMVEPAKESPQEEKKAAKGSSLDERLDAILSDKDLGL